MAEYQLYCFAQSGNAYRVALMLNLIGADWEPVFVDFFAKGVQRTPEYRAERQRDGRGAGARPRRQEAQPVGRDASPISPSGPASSAPKARTSGSRRCAGSSSTTRRSTAISAPIAFCARSPSRRAIRPCSRSSRAASTTTSRSSTSGWRSRPYMLGERPTIADLSLVAYLYYPAEEFGFDIAGRAQATSRPGSTASRRCRAGSIPTT